VVLPAVVIAFLDWLRHQFWPGFLHPWPASLFTLAVVVLLAFAFSFFVFSVVGSWQRRAAEISGRLSTLGSLALAITQRGDDASASLAGALDAVVHHFGAGSGAILLERDGRTARTAVAACSGAGCPSSEDVLALAEAFPPEALSPPQRRTYREQVSRLQGGAGTGLAASGVGSLAVASLYGGAEHRGLLLLFFRSPAAARRLDEDVLVLCAVQLGVMLENVRLHQQVRSLATVQERHRIAQELHDSLAQVLAYLHLQARTAMGLLREGRDAMAQRVLEETALAADGAYRDVREAILGLRETLSSSRDLVGSLAQYLQRFGRQAGLETHFLSPPQLSVRLSPEAEVQLLRVVQEALTNVRKHAAARHVSLRLEEVDGWLQVGVEDDGRGFAAAPQREANEYGYGLRVMRERAESVGGRLEVNSAPGEGTCVTVRLPGLRG
jgi:signal transduction histidine kinase